MRFKMMQLTAFSLLTVFLEGNACCFCPNTVVVSPVTSSFSCCSLSSSASSSNTRGSLVFSYNLITLSEPHEATKIPFGETQQFQLSPAWPYKKIKVYYN